MRTCKVIFVGESHVHAVQAALATSDFPRDDIDVNAHRLTKIKNGQLIGTLSFSDLLLIGKTLTPKDLVVSLIGGNQHSAMGLVQHGLPFDIFDADGQAPGSNHQILPRNLVKAHFDRGLRGNDGKRIRQIAESGPHRTVHMSSPPPKADEAHIMRRFETDFAAKGLLEKGLTPAPLRRRLWEIQNEVLTGILKESGVNLLPPPQGTVTEDGFLAPEYYASDATHANKAYGRKILAQVADLILIQ